MKALRDSPDPRHTPPMPFAAALPASLRAMLRPLLLVLAGALVQLAVVAVDGRPKVFTDTDDYFAQGRTFTHAVAAFVAHGRLPFAPADAWARLTDPGMGDEEPIHNQNKARSGYYGAVLFNLQKLGSLWALAAAQAAVASWLVWMLWREAARGAQRAASSAGYLGVMAALSLATSLPFFTSFAMPDVFAGFSVLSAVLLLVYGDRLGRGEAIGLWLLLAACANFHASNGPILLALAALGGLLVWRAGAGRRRALAAGGAILGAVAAAILAGSVYGLVVKLRSGDTLRRPPFLAVRVLADGPGRAYLRGACARNAHAYTLCASRTLPLDDTEDMLWADDPALGLYNAAEFPVREALSKEETRFVLHAVASDPVGEAAAALGGFARQLVTFPVAEPLENPAYYLTDSYWSDTNLPALVLGMGGCGPGLDRCGSRLPPAPLTLIHYGAVAAALAYAGWSLRRLRVLRRLASGEWDAPARLAAVAVLLLAAVVVNAAVCGALSGVFPRYQARIVWLAPLAALLLAAADRRRATLRRKLSPPTEPVLE